MSLERFKMQVLLLHSEQSTLDNLSSGFNDRYTVHCASSGSEALNTLGETQIDVIVTAQSLPGMSGLEALREARKRSPETIGILLAGDGDNDLEALVGDQEVFQIVRDKVTPQSLKTLIDSATRQARLMALAQSANDTSADVDLGEHIVMETSENGSTIISDGTGRMPALDPKKVAAAADLGARAVDVLVVSQDDEFVQTVRESARGLHNIVHANTLQLADKAVADHKIGVAVIDAAMVGSDVEQLTLHLRETATRLVSIVAGRRDDGEMLMDLINRGKVYRFLLKPVSPGRSRLAIEASVKHHLEAPDTAFVRSGKDAPALPQEKPRFRSEPVIKLEPVPLPAAKAPVKPVEKPKSIVRPRPEPEPEAQSKAAITPATVPPPRVESKVTPAPAQRKPEPVVHKREPVMKKPEPVIQKPEPVIQKPEPVIQKPEPTKPKPAPVQQEPAPVAKKPAPAVKKAPPAVPRPKVAAPAPRKVEEPRVELPDAIVARRSEALSPIHDNLGDAFGGKDSSFTDTMTDIVKSVTRSFARKSDAAPTKPPAFSGANPFPGRLKLIGFGAAAMAAVAVLAFWMFQGSTGSGETAVSIPVAAEEPQRPTTSVTEAEPAVEPAAALAPGPDIDALLAQAEQAMLERRIGTAATALQQVEAAAPDNPRLPFLRAQLTDIRFRSHLDDARLAIRESRYEDARDALGAAAALGSNDSAEIGAITAELNAALSEQQVDEVLARAASRLEEGKLIAPSNDNARYYYELALSNDPENSAARQGLITIASKLILRARAEIDRGNLTLADDLVADAYRLDPNSPELAATSEVLQATMDRREEQRRQAMARATAEREAAERAAAERAAAERAGATSSAARPAATAYGPSTVTDKPAASQPLQAAAPAAAEIPAVVGDNQPQFATAPVELPQQQAPLTDVTDEGGASAVEESAQAFSAPPAQPVAAAPITRQAPVPVSSLQRTRFVTPKYPRAAERRGISGWVDVEFTVDIDGKVTDVYVVNSEPADTFENSAMSAVENWEFAPVIENGVAIQKRAAVRLMFALQ